MTTLQSKIAHKLLKLRYAQKIINEHYKKGAFKIPIHLAFGHEAISVAIESCAQNNDPILLTHRNIHFNFLKINNVQKLLKEYKLEEKINPNAFRGSMNLDSPENGLRYTSSILGNNLAVGAGVALAEKVKNKSSLPFIMTGDGALEEGAFYESLLFMKSTLAPAVVVVENNGWSLATSIPERRCPIEIKKICDALAIEYYYLEGNDVFYYLEKINSLREKSLNTNSPIVLEIKVTTLGHWILKNDEHKNGKYVNYHAGPAKTIEAEEPFLIEASSDDPIYVLEKNLGISSIQQLKIQVVGEVANEAQK